MGPQQEDYIETVFTCEGDFDDPHLQDRLEDFKRGLNDLLLTDKNKLILKKVEPWNSVRVTFNIPREAAVRLKQLAQQGNTTLRDLGVLAVQIQDQHISLTIAGRNNERTQLVFRTADTAATAPPSVSMFNPNSPSLDELGPPGPGPSNVELTRKNIADYLRQGSSIIDSLFSQSGGDKLRTPVLGDDSHGYRPNNVLPMPGPGPGPPKVLHPPPGPHPGYISAHSPTANSVGANVNPAAVQRGSRPPNQLGLPLGFPTHTGPGVGGAPFPGGLPPPPPYPMGSTYMNSLQKLRFGTSATSPLLVNLLQNDPSMASLLASGKFPDMDQGPPPPKKTRKPRKPREKKAKAAPVDGEQPIKSVSNPVLSAPGPAQSSVPVAAQSISTTHQTMSMLTSPQRKDGLHNPQAVHNMNVQSKGNNVPLTHVGSVFRRPDDHDTAGKIINPVTGVLEPMELSDTSPAKSDGGKFSPEKLSPRLFGQRKQLAAGDIISGLITSHIRTENSLGNQGSHGTSHSGQGHLATPAVPHIAGLPHKTLGSSHMGFPHPGQSVQQKQYEEALRQKLLFQTSQPEKCEERMLQQPLRQQSTVPPPVSEHHGTELRHSVSSSSGVPQYTTPIVQSARLPQESDSKSIPTQPLLNKPLLQVKHNSVGGKPSESPDSNGDSECNSPNINLEAHAGTEPASTNIETQIDPNIKTYSNDSGVGSSSERSDDTPSEPGDNDYKSGHANSFDCAKTQITETLKHPPNTKVMTVGYAMTDNHMDLKNHKTFAPWNVNTLLNSKLNPAKLKKDTVELHSYPTSPASALNWLAKDQVVVTKPDESLPAKDLGNRKSPKLTASSPRPSSQAQQHPQLNTMQATPEPTMHKKKGSPRNSPRGSPRNPSSPRSTSSPRSSTSPRTSDPSSHGQSRQAFFTAQDVPSHLPMYSESHIKLPAGTVPNEQRKSPFSLPSARRDMGNSVGVETAQLSPQCNLGELALLKSLEAAYAHTQLNQLTGVSGNNDVAILQKLEELRPLFQQLQQRSAQAHMLNSTVSNGMDGMTQPSKSPLGFLSKSMEPHTSLAEVHSAFESVAFQNVHHPSASSSSGTTVSNDVEAGVVNCVSRGSKVSMETASVATTSAVRRTSPGAATTSCASSFNPLIDSFLPLPKRLTESIQKLVKPLPFDNSLPHPNRRSPSSSASTTKPATSSAVSPSRASSHGPVASGKKTPVGDLPHLDLDSITPSITGFNFEGPMDLHLDSYHRLHNDTSVSIPTLSLTDTHLSQFSHHVGASAAPTRLVPAVSGSILSHKTFTSDSLANSAFPSSNSLPGGTRHTNSVTVPGANTAVNTSQCNSDAKMANSSALERTAKNLLNPGHYGPPTLHPHNARYPLCKNTDRPKSPYTQMGLSEMLQETANLHSISAGRLSPHSQALSRSSPHLPMRQYSVGNELKGKTLVEKLEMSIDNHLRSKSDSPEPNTSPRTLPCCDLKNNFSDNFESSDSLSNSGSSIPPILEREVYLNSASAKLSDSSDEKCAMKVSEMAHTRVTVSQVQMTAAVDVSTASSVGQTSLCTSQSNIEQSSTSHCSENCTTSKASVSKSASPQPDSANENLCPISTGTLSNSVSLDYEISFSPSSAIPNSSLASDISSSEPKTSGGSTPIENDIAHHLRAPKCNKKPPKLPGDDLTEDTISSDPDKPRQLRSRKRTNTGESDCSNSSDDPLSKRLKLDSFLEPTGKTEVQKDTKVGPSFKSSVLTASSDSKSGEDHNVTDSIKSGLRVRSNMKNDDNKDKPKPPSRDIRKDGRTTGVKAAPDKKLEQIKADEAKKNLRTRPPSAPGSDKPVSRDKSPVRGSRTRGRNSPVVVEQPDDTQENKRTTRSARCKDPAAPLPPTPTGQDAAAAAAAKRRRQSRDHR